MCNESKETILKKINYIFEKKQKQKLVVVTFLITIGTALETIGIAAIIPFINLILYPEDVMGNQYIQVLCHRFNIYESNQLIIVMAIILMLIYIVKNIYLLFMYHIQYQFTYNSQKKLAHKMMNCYLQQPYTFHLQHNSAELINNITSDVDTFFATVLQCIQVATDASICIAVIIMLLVVDKTITISVVGVLTIFVILFVKGYKSRVKTVAENRRKYAIEITKCIQQAFGGVKEVKIMNREFYFSNNFEKLCTMHMNTRKVGAVYTVIPKPVMETICVVSLLAVISFKILLGVEAEYFIPTLSVFAVAVVRILPSASKIAANLNSIMMGKRSIDAIYTDLKNMEQLDVVVEYSDKIEDNDKMIFNEQIEIKNLEFMYPNSDKNVLNKIDIVIPKNRSIAFVGQSGAGKTTMADILLGVLRAKKGDILVDNISIYDKLQDWQRNLGYIPQTIYFTDDTIRRNIAFALDDKVIDDCKVWESLEKAQLKGFVESLEEGLDTLIGERGTRLSGGQRQRLGIARALYNDPDVLILDEATSALDNETEKAVMEAIDSLSGEKTLIIIAHRLSTICNCDIICEFMEGKVTQKENE